eukprot:gene8513-biopygen19647
MSIRPRVLGHDPCRGAADDDIQSLWAYIPPSYKQHSWNVFSSETCKRELCISPQQYRHLMTSKSAVECGGGEGWHIFTAGRERGGGRNTTNFGGDDTIPRRKVGHWSGLTGLDGLVRSQKVAVDRRLVAAQRAPCQGKNTDMAGCGEARVRCNHTPD